MINPLTSFDPDYIVYAGAIGVLLGLFFVLLFFYRRIRWIIRTLSRKRTVSLGILASLRNLVLVVLWISVFGMLLFLGAFLRSYHAFNYEEPIAEIVTEPLELPRTALLWFTELKSPRNPLPRSFTVKGDQWMIEGDILKWESWLHFLGLQTRYRLNRLRGRYLSTEAEIQQKQTIYSLVENEGHPLWRYLYLYGHRLPFVSTVYGNGVFQTSGKAKRYLVYVGPSGFIVRER
ncbi:MAG: hypothetical protein KKE57_04910 [Proteobacteria bacterium]|nr:hypothetical protein [Pseudomonadota bacterium]